MDFIIIELACELVRISDSPITVLELLCFCSTMPLNIPKDLAVLFNDAAEEEAFHNWGMFKPH